VGLLRAFSKSMLKLILRIPVLLVMARLAYEAVIRYSYSFSDGYPLWPIPALALCLWVYTKLRPRHAFVKDSMRDPNEDIFLYFLMALLGSAYVLMLRHEHPWTTVWAFHMGMLTAFQLLLAFAVGCVFTRWSQVATTIALFAVLFAMMRGTEMSRFPNMPINTSELNSEQQSHVRSVIAPASNRHTDSGPWSRLDQRLG